MFHVERFVKFWPQGRVCPRGSLLSSARAKGCGIRFGCSNLSRPGELAKSARGAWAADCLSLRKDAKGLAPDDSDFETCGCPTLVALVLWSNRVGIECGVPPKPTRYHDQRCLHFITFSCYRRAPLLGSPAARVAFENELERVRHWYGCYVAGYVVMPEHVHLLISEPERSQLYVVIQMLKQITSRKLRTADLPGANPE